MDRERRSLTGITNYDIYIPQYTDRKSAATPSWRDTCQHDKPKDTQRLIADNSFVLYVYIFQRHITQEPDDNLRLSLPCQIFDLTRNSGQEF